VDERACVASVCPVFQVFHLSFIRRLPGDFWRICAHFQANLRPSRRLGTLRIIMGLGGAGIASLVITGLVLICAIGLSIGGPIVLLKNGFGASQSKPAFIMLQTILPKTKVYDRPSLNAKVIGELYEEQVVNAMNLVIPEVGGGVAFYRIRICTFPDSMPYRFVQKDEMLDVSGAWTPDKCPLTNKTQP
jgi:hypothetical protein